MSTGADTSGFKTPNPTVWIMQVVETKGLAAAAVAGVGAMYLLGQGMQESVQFGAITALGCSVGDSALTGFGIESKIQSYITTDSKWQNYVDPFDFLGGFVGTMAVSYLAGIAEGRQLMMFSALGGVGCGVGPKIAGYVQTQYTKMMDKQDSTHASQQVSV